MKKSGIAILLLAVASIMPCLAQDYRFEVGPAFGVSGYLGDANNSNMYRHISVAGGGVFRYVHDSRWAIKGNLFYENLRGNSSDLNNKYPGGMEFKVNSHVLDLSAQAEFNFFHFGVGPRYKNYKRISPYMVVGLGAAIGFGDGKTGLSLVLPLGVGVKYKLKNRLNLGFEFTMRKAFGDGLDGITDPYGIKHGIAKNTEWYSAAVFTVTYEFSKRCVKCHYVE